MRRLALLLAPAIAFPGFAAKPAVTQLVTVAQLEDAVAGMRGSSDGGFAKRLSQMRLTQRLVESELMRLAEEMPGRRSREQLLVLADESAFLELPAEAMLPDPAPDSAAQASLLAQVSAYIKNEISQWPSHSAQREITRFEGTATVLAGGLQDALNTPIGARLFRSPAAENWECPGEGRLPTRRVDLIEHRTVPMLYRRGRTLRAVGAGGEFACAKSGVNTEEHMGDILVLLPRLLGGGKAVWSHWEQGASGRLAVFRFSATVNYTSDPTQTGRIVELKGELALDPSDGAIVRLGEVRRWQMAGYVREYDTILEFGPVTMNGTESLLPTRRVAMFLTPLLKPPTTDKDVAKAYHKYHLDKSPEQEYLNDVRFTDYRLYEPLAGSPAGGLTAQSTP